MDTQQQSPTIKYQSVFIKDGLHDRAEHIVCRECPLEIQVNRIPYVRLMRTPGLEKELAVGFCFTDGLIRSVEQITNITETPDAETSSISNVNLLIPSLGRKELPRDVPLKSSSGSLNTSRILKESLQSIPPITSKTLSSPEILNELPDKLEDAQTLRALCGSTHAAALFDQQGTCLFCAEDVGRHNGLDKLIGHALLNKIDAGDKILMLSSRASFEMMQKAVKFGVPLVATISAPTDLALHIAETLQCTYVSFRKKGGYNVYTHPWRLGLA